ncbi:MAG TPA: nucleoside deaminase [Candidatus Omnitrophota bacterium]|nr:nucleoside deaminase [Candidatus Omnitrophota bacterium]
MAIRLEAQEKYMRLAIAKAQEGIAKGQTPFGACIVKDEAILSCAHNAVWDTTDITAHAEICAIREACRNTRSISLEGSVIYSTCEPCPMCFSACHWARVEVIVYGAGIADAQKAGFHELAISDLQMKDLGRSPLTIIPGFLAGECVALFDLWSRQETKKAY